MEIVIDERGTVTNISFCCMKLARKILPTTPYGGSPIVIKQPHGIVEGSGITFFYCPYCGEKIETYQKEGELYDPFSTEDSEDESSDNRNMRKLIEEMENEEDE